MILFFKNKAKSSKEKLEEKYNRLLNEIFEFSTTRSVLTDRKFDKKLVEAQKILRQISQS